MSGSGLGLKAAGWSRPKFLALVLALKPKAKAAPGLGLELCGLVNITIKNITTLPNVKLIITTIKCHKVAFYVNSLPSHINDEK